MRAVTAVRAPAPPEVGAIPAGERQALVDLDNATGGASWTDTTSWLGPAGTECTWHGVQYDAEETTVTWLVLVSNNHTGALPSSIDHRSGLTHLRLTTNPLSEAVPPELGNLSSPQGLGLESKVVLGGPIPPELGNLTQLANLKGCDTQLTGTPTALGHSAFTVTVTDAPGRTGTGGLELDILAPGRGIPSLSFPGAVALLLLTAAAALILLRSRQAGSPAR